VIICRARRRDAWTQHAPRARFSFEKLTLMQLPNMKTTPNVAVLNNNASPRRV
jgi:hypothetical protein